MCNFTVIYCCILL